MNAAELVKIALGAQKNAYAPYSKFSVGAAVETDDGRVFSGCNVENASYGLTVCAERVAVFSAVAAGARRITAVAVVTKNGSSPCGACRQVLEEFALHCNVHLSTDSGEFVTMDLATLLPRAFGPRSL